MPNQIDELAEQWRAAGIRRGDIVLIHSSIRRTAVRLRSERASEIVLDSFQNAVGESGTLVLPLFNFDFAAGRLFDLRSTPSQMGALTESARRRPEAIRTCHPVYSFAALGSAQNAFRGVDNFSGYGSDSPFAILHSLGGKIAVLDLSDQNSMTFYHYVEEAHQVSYRYHKRFTGPYCDARGVTSNRTYGIFVRDIDRGVVTDVNPIGELLWDKGLYSGERPGIGAGLRVIEAAALYDAASTVITSGRAKGLLYHIVVRE